MIEALDHVLMFVPSVRSAAEWYASVLGVPATFLDENFALYRGPLAIGSGQGICQVADPFGNLFGLIGAYNGG